MNYLREYNDESTGMAYRMLVGSNGKHRIVAQDVDSGNYLPFATDYPTLDAANAAFDKIVAAVKKAA
jgi:hypothetical protein